MINERKMMIMEKEKHKMILQQPATEIIKIKGVGTVEVYGKMNMEKMVERMLQSKHITG
jgi:hypothetical protein